LETIASANLLTGAKQPKLNINYDQQQHKKPEPPSRTMQKLLTYTQNKQNLN